MLLCFEILYVLWLCFVANVVTDTGQATCPVLNRYRTFDGSCNNLANPTWGQAGTAYRRFMDADGNPMVDYHDDVHLPRGGFPTTLPSPRLVSNMISNSSLGPVDQTDNARSLQNMAFGQLMAHDFVKTRIPLGNESQHRKKEPCYLIVNDESSKVFFLTSKIQFESDCIGLK